LKEKLKKKALFVEEEGSTAFLLPWCFVFLILGFCRVLSSLGQRLSP
jgi:hypothetical protein